MMKISPVSHDSHGEFHNNFRMTMATFVELLSEIKPFITPHGVSFRADMLQADKKLAMTLCHQKDQGSYRMIRNFFGVSVPTLSVVLRQVCGAIAKHSGPKYIVFPSTRDELHSVMPAFERKFGFPMAVTCVDGTHIAIRQPLSNASDFFCSLK